MNLVTLVKWFRQYNNMSKNFQEDPKLQSTAAQVQMLVANLEA